MNTANDQLTNEVHAIIASFPCTTIGPKELDNIARSLASTQDGIQTAIAHLIQTKRIKVHNLLGDPTYTSVKRVKR